MSTACVEFSSRPRSEPRISTFSAIGIASFNNVFRGRGRRVSTFPAVGYRNVFSPLTRERCPDTYRDANAERAANDEDGSRTTTGRRGRVSRLKPFPFSVTPPPLASSGVSTRSLRCAPAAGRPAHETTRRPRANAASTATAIFHFSVVFIRRAREGG